MDTRQRPRELPPLLFAEDVARALRITVTHARRIMASGEVPSRKRGARWVALREEFIESLRPERASR